MKTRKLIGFLFYILAAPVFLAIAPAARAQGIYIGPYIETIEGSRTRFGPPDGATAGVCLLSPGGALRAGIGVFTSKDELRDPYVLLSDAMDKPLDAHGLDLWNAQFHVELKPEDAPATALWDLFTVHSDPEGRVAPKPIMPATGGKVEMNLGGYSRVQNFEGATDPAWAKVQAVWQNDYRALRTSLGSLSTAKTTDVGHYLAAEMKRFAGKATFAQLAPAEFQDVQPTTARSTYTDDFNRADENPLAGNWTTTPGGNPLRIVSNQVGSNRASGRCAAYYSAITWPDDQYSQCTKPVLADEGGPSVRLNTGGTTQNGYVWSIKSATNSSMDRINSAESSTVLQTLNGLSLLVTDTLYIEIQGSTIKAFQNATQIGTNQTDTTFSSGAAGLYILYQYGSDRFGDWQGGDFAAPPAPPASGFKAWLIPATEMNR